jgi:hypothetical protein
MTQFSLDPKDPSPVAIEQLVFFNAEGHEHKSHVILANVCPKLLSISTIASKNPVQIFRGWRLAV